VHLFVNGRLRSVFDRQIRTLSATFQKAAEHLGLLLIERPPFDRHLEGHP
jgi:hypothetical protein